MGGMSGIIACTIFPYMCIILLYCTNIGNGKFYERKKDL